MKIAVCVSGQTRRHNFYKDKWLEDLNELFGPNNCDLYGHTWRGQPAPHYMNLFKGYTCDDQDMIKTWVDKNPFQRMYHNQAWLDNPEYRDMMKDGRWYEHALDATVRAYGQYWSALLCFKQIEQDYDIIVRYRWDIGINKTNLNDVRLAITNFKKAQKQGTESIPGEIRKDIDPLIPADVLVSTPHRSDYIPDMFFVSNNKILKCNDHPIAYWMDRMMKLQYPDKPVAHIGWATLLKALELKTVSAMPTIHYDLDDCRKNSENASGNNYFPDNEF